MRPNLNFGAQIQNAACFTKHNVPILEDGQSHTVTAVVQLGQLLRGTMDRASFRAVLDKNL